MEELIITRVDKEKLNSILMLLNGSRLNVALNTLEKARIILKEESFIVHEVDNDQKTRNHDK